MRALGPRVRRFVRVAIASALGLSSLLLGCSKSDEAAPKPPLSIGMGTRVAPGSPSPGASADPGAAKRSPFDPDPGDFDVAPITYTITVTIDAATTRVDPDDAVVQAGRVAASQCFAGLVGGPDVRSAVIRVTVVPTGSVSRTEVSSDPDVADCLRRVGDGLHFSARDDSPGKKDGADNGGAGIRSFSIDVAVTHNH